MGIVHIQNENIEIDGKLYSFEQAKKIAIQVMYYLNYAFSETKDKQAITFEKNRYSK